VEHHQGGIRRRPSDESPKIGAQIALKNLWRIVTRDFQRRAKQLQAVSFIRPHQRFEPGDLVAVVDINWRHVQTSAPDYFQPADRQ
jgi:hypothetical protein